MFAMCMSVYSKTYDCYRRHNTAINHTMVSEEDGDLEDIVAEEKAKKRYVYALNEIDNLLLNYSFLHLN